MGHSQSFCYFKTGRDNKKKKVNISLYYILCYFVLQLLKNITSLYVHSLLTCAVSGS